MTKPTMYWEDFPVGSSRELGSVTVPREEIIEFASRYDPQPFHLDEAAASQTLFGGLIASGWHTCSLLMRMMCDSYLLNTASYGSPGLDNIRWLKPVRPGDTLRGRYEILEARPMASKPQIGLVRSRWIMLNQLNEEVLTMEGWNMIGLRPPA